MSTFAPSAMGAIATFSRRLIPMLVLLLLLLSLLFWQDRVRPLQYRLSNPVNDDSFAKPTIDTRPPFYPGIAKPPGSNYSRIIVVSKTEDEDVSWIRNELPDLPLAVYEVDNPTVGFRVPQNKGHEAMGYLTYIIDHYDELPDTVIFAHAHQQAWHNNILLDLDNAVAIKRLRDDRVARQGYMNLRCHHDPGCPDWIRLDRAEVDYDEVKKPEENVFSFKLFAKLFPGHRPPPVLSQACCAQFAVSGERIRDNPRALYERLRQWLLDTSLPDNDSGRVFEYIWQYLFTRNAEHCPPMNACYCDGYGICFGNATKLNDWLKKRKMWEEMDNEEARASGEGKEEDVLREISERRDSLNRKLDEEKAEAYRRGEKEEYRAIERERLQEYPYT